jgi:hypothetical protein
MNGPTRLDAKAGGRSSASTGIPIGLIAGDVITLILVTVIGFASHGTLETAGSRILATFVPLLAAWAAVAPPIGAYDRSRLADLRQVWRPAWAMVLAGPLMAVLRGLWLNAPVIPTFAVVMSAVGAAGILAWRLLYGWLQARWTRRAA